MKRYFDGCRTAEELKKAYRQAAKELHPDAGGGEEEFKAMQAEFSAAWSRLKNIHVTKDGEKYEKEIEDLVYGGEISQKESVLVTNVRHAELLSKSAEALRDAARMAEQGEALDFIHVDLNEAYESLGEIIGETVSDDVLNEVFSRFCLGK